MDHFPLGTRVRLRRDVERFPHFIAPAGATGTVSYVDREMTAVHMDEPIPGCEDWENEIMWYEMSTGPDDMAAELSADLEALP